MTFATKKEELKKYFPRPAYNLREGQGLSLLMDILGDPLDEMASEQGNARDQFLLSRAGGSFLDDHGQDRDVFRPKGFRMTDATYRELIKIVTNSQKNIENVFEKVLVLFFGPNSIVNGLADVYSYQKNQIIVEIQENALIIASSRDLYGTHYIHRDPSNAFDGWGTVAWTGTLLNTLLPGDTSLEIASLPSGVPSEGIIEIGTSGSASYEIKLFERSGNIFTLHSGVQYEHLLGSALRGPKNPDDYPNGYIYQPENQSSIFGVALPGASSFSLGAGFDDLSTEGVLMIGNPESANFETKGFTRTGNTVNLKGVLTNLHPSGDAVVEPTMPGSIRTNLDQGIVAGNSYSQITVVNAADFPAAPYEGVMVLNRSFGNTEFVPFKGRVVGDNTQIVTDSSFTFINDHSAGEQINLMSLKTAPEVDGTDFAFFLNDTDSLRQQLFSILSRLKVFGCKIVFEII